jgi:hypothetical protein
MGMKLQEQNFHRPHKNTELQFFRVKEKQIMIFSGELQLFA